MRAKRARQLRKLINYRVKSCSDDREYSAFQSGNQEQDKYVFHPDGSVEKSINKTTTYFIVGPEDRRLYKQLKRRYTRDKELATEIREDLIKKELV